MKKFLAIFTGAVVAGGIIGAVVYKLEVEKRKKELKKKDPKELVELLADAAIVLDMESSLDLDEELHEKFESLKSRLKK